MKKQLVIALIVTILSAVSGFAVSFSRIGEIAQEQYYRGAYDVCVMFATRVYSLPPDRAFPSCIENMAYANKVNWYAQESHGWQWPLPIAESP